MAPTIHCIRHAQGYHNLTTANHIIRDPDLTPLGVEQCATLSKEFPDMDKIDLIVASPIRRTLYTALLTFSTIIKSRHVPVIALPELQETSDLPCDTGSDPAKLLDEFENGDWKGVVDFGLVKDGWNIKENRDGVLAAPNASAIISRARAARRWLRSQTAKNIAVVTHGGYLHYFTDDWEGIVNFSAGSGWSNTEFRSYEFLDGQDAPVVETHESRERRRGNERPLGEAEMRDLRRSVVTTWTDLGYIRKMPEEVGEGWKGIWKEIVGTEGIEVKAKA